MTMIQLVGLRERWLIIHDANFGFTEKTLWTDATTFMTNGRMRGVFRKRPEVLISVPTSTQSVLRLMSAPIVKF
jgi:hypothetical protein